MSFIKPQMQRYSEILLERAGIDPRKDQAKAVAHIQGQRGSSTARGKARVRSEIKALAAKPNNEVPENRTINPRSFNKVTKLQGFRPKVGAILEMTDSPNDQDSKRDFVLVTHAYDQGGANMRSLRDITNKNLNRGHLSWNIGTNSTSSPDGTLTRPLYYREIDKFDVALLKELRDKGVLRLSHPNIRNKHLLSSSIGHYLQKPEL